MLDIRVDPELASTPLDARRAEEAAEARALRLEGRAARAQRGEFESTLTDKTKMADIIGDETEADRAMYLILQSKRAPELARKLMVAAKSAGKEKEFILEMRRAAIDWVFQVGVGGAAPSVVRGAPTVRRKIAQLGKLKDTIFTPRQLKFLEKNLDELSKEMGGGTVRKGTANALSRIRNQVAYIALGGGIGGFAGEAAVGIAAGSALEMIARSMGPRAARELAVSALYDPQAMRMLTEKGGSTASAAFVQGLISTAMRRGGIAAFPGDESPVEVVESE